MLWKNLPYWLKGSIIGMIYFFTIFVIELIFGGSCFTVKSDLCGVLSMMGFLPIFALVDWLANMVPIFQYTEKLGDYILSNLIFLSSAIIIGALIGWLIGKFKK